MGKLNHNTIKNQNMIAKSIGLAAFATFAAAIKLEA